MSGRNIRPIIRGSMALLLVGGFIVACFVEVAPEALTALATAAGSATAFYFGEDKVRNGEH